MLLQSTQDFLAVCQIWSDLATPIFNMINALLNPLGFFLPSARSICLAIFNALESTVGPYIPP